MKTEAEIRKYRDALIIANNRPCNCARTGHATQCLIGGRILLAVITELTWALDEAGPEMEQHVERVLAEYGGK